MLVSTGWDNQKNITPNLIMEAITPETPNNGNILREKDFEVRFDISTLVYRKKWRTLIWEMYLWERVNTSNLKIPVFNM